MSILLGASLGALLVGALWLLLHRRASGWLLITLGCAVSLVLLRKAIHLYGYHGLMHASLVYRILAVGVPPDDPFTAGAPLQYPWAHHALIAMLVRVLDITPGIAFAISNIPALAATLFLLYRVAGELTTDRVARILGVALAVYGISPILRGPVSPWIPHAKVMYMGALYPIVKFLEANSNQLGFLGFALFLLLLLRLLARPQPRGSDALLLGATVLGTALLYPFVWSAAVVVGLACALAIVARHGHRARKAVLLVAAAIGGGSILALPYLLPLQAGRSQPSLAPLLSFEHLEFTILATLLALGPAVLFALTLRRAFWSALEERTDAWICLAVAGAVPGAIFLLSHAPDHAEHKLLTLTCIAIGLMAGVPLAALRQRRPWTAALLLWLAVLPASQQVRYLATADRGDTDAFVAEGWLLQPRDPAERALYDWIREHTPANAVFVDDHLEIALCAHRALYVPVRRPDMRPGSQALAGWNLYPLDMARVALGRTEKLLRERTKQARLLLSADPTPLSDELLEAVRESIRPAPVYVIARRPAAARQLGLDPRFERVFERPPLAVFALP